MLLVRAADFILPRAGSRRLTATAATRTTSRVPAATHRRNLALFALAAVALTALPAAAQTGAGRGLSSPTAEPQPTPTVPAEPAMVPPPPSYGGPAAPQVQVEDPTARAARRRRDGGDRTQKHVGNALAVVGGAVLANTWIPMALAGVMVDRGWLVVPGIGPFVAIAEDPGLDQEIFWLDGILQIAGLAALVVGLTMRFTFDDPLRRAEARVAPWVAPGAGGLGMTGVF